MKHSHETTDRRFSRENPFTVPEGYFAQLQKSVMDSLPAQQPNVVVMMTKRNFLRPLIAAAASVCIAVFGMAVWLGGSSKPVDEIVLAESVDFADMLSDVEGAADYVMMDNEDIYAFVSQN